MKRSFAALLVLVALAGPTWAADRKFDADAIAKAVAPFVEDGTFLIAHVDLTRLDPDKLMARAAAITGVAASDFASSISDQDRERLKELQDAGAKDVFFVLAIADILTKGGAIIIPVPQPSSLVTSRSWKSGK